MAIWVLVWSFKWIYHVIFEEKEALRINTLSKIDMAGYLSVANLWLLRNSNNRKHPWTLLSSLNYIQIPVFETEGVSFLEGGGERRHLPVERIGFAVEVSVKNREEVTGAEEKWIGVRNSIWGRAWMSQESIIALQIGPYDRAGEVWVVECDSSF